MPDFSEFRENTEEALEDLEEEGFEEYFTSC
jgi:hypothetical protein